MGKNPTLSPHAYLVWLCVAAVATFCLLWIYILFAPMPFLEGGYPVAAADHEIIAKCDLGSLVIFGDSEAQVGIDPKHLPEISENISFAGASPIELYYVAEAAMRCGHLPKRIVLSIAIPNFTTVSKFLWQNHVRFGFLGLRQLIEVRTISAKLGDNTFADTVTQEGLSGWPRDVLYSAHFPPFYFSSLANGRVFLRYWENKNKFAEVLRSRGYVPYQHELDPAAVGEEAHLTHFVPLPIQDYYFNRTLALLSDHGLEIDFVLMPISEKTFQGTSKRVLDEFSAYLARYAARYENFRFLGRITSPWPDEYFSDESHLNPRGADLFSSLLGGCLRLAIAEAKPRDAAECDLEATSGSFKSQ